MSLDTLQGWSPGEKVWAPGVSPENYFWKPYFHSEETSAIRQCRNLKVTQRSLPSPWILCHPESRGHMGARDQHKLHCWEQFPLEENAALPTLWKPYPRSPP